MHGEKPGNGSISRAYVFQPEKKVGSVDKNYGLFKAFSRLPVRESINLLHFKNDRSTFKEK